jgi:primosomal protein N' (replication factor Y)
MLPPGLGQQVDTLFSLNPRPPSDTGQNLSDLQERLLEMLKKRGPMRGRQIDPALPRQDWRIAARSLVRRGLIMAQSLLLPPSVRPKKLRTAQLACPLDVAEKRLSDLGRAGTPALKRRQAMLRYLMREPGPVDVSWLYAESGGNLADLHKLADMDLVVLGRVKSRRDPLEPSSRSPPSRLP